MKGNILRAKPDSNGLADAGVDFGNYTGYYVELKAKKRHKFSCILGCFVRSFLLGPDLSWGMQF